MCKWKIPRRNVNPTARVSPARRIPIGRAKRRAKATRCASAHRRPTDSRQRQRKSVRQVCAERSVDGKRHVEVIEQDIAEATFVNVPSEKHRAITFGGRTQKDTRAGRLAVAGFEVRAFEGPRLRYRYSPPLCCRTELVCSGLIFPVGVFDFPMWSRLASGVCPG